VNDDELQAALSSVAAHLDLSAPPRHTSARRAIVAGLAVALLAAAVLSVEPARRTVSGWLRIGRTELHRADVPAPPADVPSFATDLPAISRDEAERRLGHPLPDLAGTPIGEPAAVLAPPEGGVIAAWDDGTTLWMLANDGDVLFGKTVPTAQRVTELPDLGDGGALVDGEHLLQTPHRLLSADTAVLWTSSALAFRLDSPSRDPTELVTLAIAIDQA
jgi:hypothetical protein